jgi:hypothetical protein
MKMLLSLVSLAALLGSSVPAQAQPEVDIARRKADAAGHPLEPAPTPKPKALDFRRLSEAEVRAIAAQSAHDAKGDPDRFMALALRAILKLVPAFSFEPLMLAYTDGLGVFAAGPATNFMISAREAVRKMEPIDRVAWGHEIVVLVLPRTIEAPDIEKVVVMRDGSIVTPVQSTLAPATLTTAMGASVVVHQGVLTYPLPAFDPGGSVVVTAIPATGRNVVATISERDLMKLQ